MENPNFTQNGINAAASAISEFVTKNEPMLKEMNDLVEVLRKNPIVYETVQELAESLEWAICTGALPVNESLRKATGALIGAKTILSEYLRG